LSHSETEPENSGDEEKKEEAERVMSISKKLKIPKKRIKTMPIPIKGDAIRPPLALNKTSVEMIRIGQTSILQKHGDQVDASVTREIALFKRLTKFRRKPNWSNKPALPGGIIERDLNMGKVVPKCKYTIEIVRSICLVSTCPHNITYLYILCTSEALYMISMI